MRDNGTGANGDAVPRDDAAQTAEETKFVLDDELDTAASPFFYLFTALLIAIGAYFVYWLLRG
jgi:hypothetical protein